MKAKIQMEEPKMKFFDKAIALTKPVKELADGLKACAESVKILAESVAVIAHNQAVHHHMIMQMWSVQQQIFNKLTSGGLDTKMPDITGKKATKSDKSN